jgi:hypothetical protein
MIIKDRATPFHSGYRIEQRSTDRRRASIFTFVYPHGHRGTQYIVRHGVSGREILRIWIEK